MTYTVVGLIYRKQSLTPHEFRTHYDTVHVPLLKSLVGDLFPQTHTRQYVRRRLEDDSPDGLDRWKPALLRGEPSDFPFDAITVMVWEDEAAFERFKAVFYQEEVQRRITEDEERFQDRHHKPACLFEEPSVSEGEDWVLI